MAIQSINTHLCIGCGRCRDICPVDVIRIDTKIHRATIVYGEDCMMCQLCVVECPQDAITVTPEKRDPLPVSWA